MQFGKPVEQRAIDIAEYLQHYSPDEQRQQNSPDKFQYFHFLLHFLSATPSSLNATISSKTIIITAAIIAHILLGGFNGAMPLKTSIGLDTQGITVACPAFKNFNHITSKSKNTVC